MIQAVNNLSRKKKVLERTANYKPSLVKKFFNKNKRSLVDIISEEFLCLEENITIKEAINHIRYGYANRNNIEICFITDKNKKIKGFLHFRELILNNENTVIKDIMNTDVIFTKVKESPQKVASKLRENDLICIPVVDDEYRLIGIINVDDIINLYERQNSKEVEANSEIKSSEEPYLKMSIFGMAKHRVVWLLILMISATITGSIIKNFDDVLQSTVLLAAFIPMLMDTGGNSGSQSSTLVIRGLALGEIRTSDYLKVIWKEFRVSLIVSSILSSVNFFRIYFIEKTDLLISITVSASLFLTVIIAKVVGGILPLAAKKLNLDPAIMASPLITTIVDTFALLIYFSFAKFLLGI